jgi:hypothetical protein
VPCINPRLALVAASLLAAAAIAFYATDSAPAKPDSIRLSSAAETSAPVFDSTPEAVSPSADTPPVAAGEPARGSVLAFHAPKPSTGQRLNPRSAQVIKVAATGARPVGRSAEIDAGTFANLAALHADDAVRIPLIDGELVDGVIHLVQPDEDGTIRVGGEMKGARKGTFMLASKGDEVFGFVLLPRERLAIEIAPQKDGRTLLVEKSLGDVVCQPLPRYTDEQPLRALAPGQANAIPILNSRPGVVAQLYLDFDGETVTDPAWNGGATIVAAAPNVSDADVTTVFKRVTEDWWPFNINITTDVTKYNSAPVKKRMRCIITPTDTAAPGAGGVAYLFSFNGAGGQFSNTIPCWVFNGGIVGIAEAISHELGHTMGLFHDGREIPGTGHEEYFLGHGSGATSWCPIMGAGYYVNVVQWSKGEYEFANNQEDDLAIISNATNSFGYAPDAAGDTLATATQLNLNATTGVVNQVELINKTDDIDFYSFATTGGNVSIIAAAATVSPNLDISLALLDSNGIQIGASNPGGALNASITLNNLPSGGYFVKVANSGAGNPLTDGYTNYASLGAYTLTGTVQGATLLPVILSPGVVASLRNDPFSYQIVAANSPTSFSCVGALPPGTSFFQGTGVIAGTPTVSGNYVVTIGATNSKGSSSKQLTISITSGTVALPVALDAISYVWSSGGDTEWGGQKEVAFDGVDAAQSGTLGDNQSTYIETTVSGPGSVNFSWKVDSEPVNDFVSFAIDGVEKTRQSGNQDWQALHFDFANGTHKLRWTYSKNGSINTGADTAFVDTVSISQLPPPVITSAGAVSGNLGSPFQYQITTISPATSYSVSAGLPPGLGLNTSNGLISGTPTQLGTFNATISATNQAGPDARNLEITITPHAFTISEAVDSPPALTWTSLGTAEWFGQELVSDDGIDAAQSGVIGNNQVSEMQTTVFGPASVRFRWKVSSETNFDVLSFLIDNTVQGKISGEIDWQDAIFAVPAGQHLLRWRYSKDNGFSSGTDTAWVDRFAFDTRPFISSPLTVEGRVGKSFHYETRTIYPANSMDAGALPAGLNFHSDTGLIDGTPTAPGAVAVDLSATNGSGTSNATLRIVIDPDVSGSDLVSAATPLAGSWVQLQSTNVTATNEPAEPVHGGFPPSHSMWWTWIAPSSGAVIVSTQGSSFDTTLDVYRGDALSNLVLAAQNDNANRKVTYSRVSFLAEAGQKYFVAVDGVQGATGDIALNIVYKKGALYTGFVDTVPDGKHIGVVSLKVTSAQRYTGSFVLSGKRYAFKGQLDPSAASLHALGGGLSLSLTSDPSDGTDVVGGAITGPNAFTFSAVRSIAPVDVPLAAIGGYTIAAERASLTPGVPAGAGTATAKLTRAGKVRVAGTLADGAPFAGSGFLHLDGVLPLFTKPYRSGGSFSVPLSFDLQADLPTIQGEAQWTKAPASTPLYSAGFDTTTIVKGGRYIEPPRGTALLSFTAALLDFTGSDFVFAPAQESITISPRNALVPEGAMPGFSLKFDLPSGRFNGSFIPVAGQPKHTFTGVILRAQDRGTGSFLGTAESGALELHASP